MPRKKIDFETVRQIGRALPGVEEGTAYGTPALKIRGTLIVCLANHSSAEPGTLAARVDITQRADMIETDPDVYYLTDHYVNHPFVLARLSCVRFDALRDLVATAHRLASAQQSRARPAARRRPPAARRKL